MSSWLNLGKVCELCVVHDALCQESIGGDVCVEHFTVGCTGKGIGGSCHGGLLLFAGFCNKVFSNW